MVELLKQPQYAPMPVEEQVVSIFAATRGYMDDVEVEHIADFEKQLLAFMRDQKSEVMDELAAAKDLTDSIEKSLRAAIDEFKKTYRPG